MTDSLKIIYFEKESKVKIGNVTYIVNSYFDKNNDTVIDKIKNLLISEIQKSS